LLGAYNFDCDDAANFPQFETASSESGKGASAKTGFRQTNEDPCQVDKDQGNYDPPKSYVNLCAPNRKRRDRPRQGGDQRSTGTVPNTKVLTMHYCFQALHARLLPAPDWGSQSDLSPQRKAKFLAEREQARTELDNQVMRLDAFMSLGDVPDGEHSREIPAGRLRLSYSVSSPPIVSLFSNYCTPVRTAPIHNR